MAMKRKPLEFGMSIAILCVAGLLVTSAGPVYAQNPNIGTSGAQFLKIPVGGRASAMGGAFVSNANDVSSIFWNPAGIVSVKSSGLLFAHSEWWATIQLNHAAFVQSLEGIGSFGVSVTVLSMDNMDVTTEDAPEGTGETFDAGDLMIGLTYARKLTEDFSVGVTAKFVQERIWNETASGIAFDVGTQYRIGFRDLAIGMSMTNFGGDMTYNGRDLSVDYAVNPRNTTTRLAPANLTPDDYPLPLHFQVGVSMSPYVSENFTALLAADVAHPNDNQERVDVGIELTILKQFFLRGGYRFGYDTDRATLGAGVSVPVGDFNLTFDYAYATYDLLPNISRFSLGMTF
jgi:hypothetical protein